MAMGKRLMVSVAAWGLAASIGGGGSAQAAWRKAESDHFIVYGRSDKIVREYATMLEDFDDLLRTVHGRAKVETTPVRKLPIYLAPTQTELRRILPSANGYIAGFYSPTVTDVFAVVIKTESNEGDWNKGDDFALHEYVHHFMMQYYSNAYPAWLSEGYSEYYMTASLESDRRVIGDFNRARALSLLEPGMVWHPIEDILRKRPGELGKWNGPIYYAQSWVLTHYILSDPQRQALLPRYLEVVRGGRDPVAAWKDVFGDDPDALTDKLRRYLNRSLQVKVLPRPQRFTARMTITALPSAADDLLLDAQRLKLGVEKEDRPKLLASIRSDAAKAPNDRFARLVLARAEVFIGDRAQGQAILTALLAANPNDEEALILLGESHLANGYEDEARRAVGFAEAGKLFVRAFKINPDNPATLHGYADARALEPLTDNLVNVRLKAVELAPQISHLRLDAAQALIEKKRFDAARTVLIPLASNPHGGGDVDTARTLLRSLPPEAALATKPEGDKKASGG